jgi:hypothetical protein
VLEVRRSALHETLSVTESGKITSARSFPPEPDDAGFGRVPAERVEKLHDLLRKVKFCTLAPKRREMSPGYITIKASFSDVACEIELPDARWRKDPSAKKVIDAVRKLEDEGCPTGCKP